MQEKSYLGFLFSAIHQNHSSLPLLAQHSGLVLVLHWAGHTAAEMLMQEQGPLCSTGQEGRLHLQLSLLLSVELWAETSCSHLYSCSPCCLSEDSRSSLAQIRLQYIVCFGRQSPLCNPPGQGRYCRGCHLVKASPGLQGMGWLILWLGCQEKLNSTSTLDHGTGGFGEWKPLVASHPPRAFW